MNVSKNSKAGFSLIELMVVVAIIGILATIAVPNFQKFQARSKQTNAKAELSAIYSAQKSFYAEYSTYSAWLNAVGFVPEGVDGRYSVIVGVKRYYGVSSGNPLATDSGNLTQTLFVTFTNAYAGGYQATSQLCNTAFNLANLYAATGGVTPGVVINTDAFSSQAIGCPLAGNQATADAWWIDNNRNIKNHVSGIQ